VSEAPIPSAPADLEVIAQLKSKLQYAELRIRVLEEQLRLMRIEKYGAGGEKLSKAQMELFDRGPVVAEVMVEAESEPEPVHRSTTKCRKHPGRQELPANLPRVERILPCTPDQRVCKRCGKETVVIGAFRKLRLAEVEPWLEHLSSCSPCFQEFTELRKQAASQRRRTQFWLAAAAVLIFAVAGWLWMRTQHSVQPTETAVLDLRELSVGRGQNSPQTDQRPLEIHRSAKHLTLELPIGSKEGAYDIAILSESGAQILGASGTAKLQDHIVSLRADVDVGGVSTGLYFLALRQPGLEWTRYPLRVF